MNLITKTMMMTYDDVSMMTMLFLRKWFHLRLFLQISLWRGLSVCRLSFHYGNRYVMSVLNSWFKRCVRALLVFGREVGQGLEYSCSMDFRGTCRSLVHRADMLFYILNWMKCKQKTQTSVHFYRRVQRYCITTFHNATRW